MSHDHHDYSARVWRTTSVQLESLLKVMANNKSNKKAVGMITYILGFERYRPAVEAMLPGLHDADDWIRRSVAQALGHMDDSRAMEALLETWHETDSDVRQAAVKGLRYTSDDEIDRRLLAVNFEDGWWDSFDPKEAIDEERVKKAAKELELPIEEVRRRYEGWSARSHGLIRLAWSDEG